jgi:hypothetical protein
MSGSFENQIDHALDLRHQRRRQRQAEQAQSKKAIDDVHAELERKQSDFSERVRSLVEQAVADANRHLATRPEGCQLCRVSGYFTGPWYPGGSACTPIAYELRVDGQDIGETLIVELSFDGLVEASLGPFRPHVAEGHTTRLDLGWPPIPLENFDMEAARDLVVRYMAVITIRCPL